MKNFIDKLSLVDIKDRKVLMAKSFNKDKWFNPGGKREPGETDEQALIREIKEELSIDIIPDTIKLYNVFEAQAHGKPKGTMVRLACYTASYKGTPKPSAEIEHIDYFDYSKKDLTSLVSQLFFDDLKKKNLID
ncbi:MAG: DNA mismatch repair protein MutT [Parcubacteria group bacterium]|nr:DNA mismatch repair protein MutT [Parcubacteria group bacterium]